MLDKVRDNSFFGIRHPDCTGRGGNQRKHPYGNASAFRRTVLRHHAAVPDTLKIRMETPGGNVKYDFRVMKSQQYMLEELLHQGAISEYTRCTIIDMSNKVLEHIAAKYNSVKEGVKAVMGGKVLEYEAKTIKREGIREGRREGIEQGENRLSLLIAKLMESNRSQDVIRAAQDKQYRNKLYEEYLIDNEK